MRIDSAGPVVAGLIVAVLAAAALALLWHHRILRIVVSAISVLAVVTTSALQLNRLTETYPSWSALVGKNPASEAGGAGADPASGSGGASASGLALEPAPGRLPAAGGGSGRIVEFQLAGRESGMSMPVYVYLPAGYDRSTARFPVIEATHGVPGSPKTWLNRLDVVQHLNREISAGRMAPTVVVFPYQTTSPLLDTECTNMTGGPQAETYLTRDVPAVIAAKFRVRTDRAGWGLIGYSAGGFCSINLILRHPGQFAAAASLSGYSDAGIKIGDGSEKTTNFPLWRLRHLPHPPIGLYLAWANDDKHTRADGAKMVKAATAPIAVTTAVVAHGGHADPVWQAMEGPAFDWLSSWLARPEV